LWHKSRTNKKTGRRRTEEEFDERLILKRQLEAYKRLLESRQKIID